jgi:Protein of unknown function (DUF3298)
MSKLPAGRSQTFRTSGGKAACATVASHIERMETKHHSGDMARTSHFILLLSASLAASSWTCSRQARESATQTARAQTSASLSPSPSPTPSPSKPSQVERIDRTWASRFKFATKSIAKKHQGNRGYEISVDFPQIRKARTSSTRKFNRWMRTKILGYVAQFRRLERAAEVHDKRKKLPPLDISESLELSCRVYYSDERLISLRLTHTVMAMGQMHKIAYYETINYDLKKDRLLSLKDLYRSQRGYLRTVSAYCRNELKRKYQTELTNDQWIDEGTIPQRNNFANWNIVADGILLSFEDYQVGSHAFGQPELIVPYAVLKHMMLRRSLAAKFLK